MRRWDFSALAQVNLWLMVGADAAAITLAHYLAHAIRFERLAPGIGQDWMDCLVWMLPLKIAALWFFGLYRGMWRYAGVHDMRLLVRANLVSSIIAVLIILGVYQFQGFSRSVFIIDFVLSVLLMGFYRMGIRMAYSGDGKIMHWTGPKEGRTLKKVLIIGAGDMGEKVVREIRDSDALDYRAVGIVDDDRRKHHRHIHGVPIMGGIQDLNLFAQRTGADELIIAVSMISADGMRRIVNFCESTGLPFKTVPGLWEMIEGRRTVTAMRRVRYEDLLGRTVVRMDEAGIGGCLTGKTVLVTGGAGSIGSELCRQIIRFLPRALILMDKNESGLYDMEHELSAACAGVDIRVLLGSVRNPVILDRSFEKWSPDVVFHAAAYKHVPMMETHPWEAVFNNILGTREVMAACDRHHVGRVVLVSTDKAVRPTNVMGTTKRVAELLTQAYAARNGNKFMAVRFGNVVGSVGSVVPLFRSQIERGGPVTVTHPDVTRYFMTIPEACSLILQAGAMGNGGEIFILKMGTPIRILDMAKDIITLNGLTPGVDIEIKFTGLRPGEKLYEELITQGEGIVPTDHEDIMVLKPENILPLEDLMAHVGRLRTAAAAGDGDVIRQELKVLVPEYVESRERR